MTDRQLKYLITLAEEGNMTAAARKLYISQPSLSSLLSHVEEELGVKLFDRDAKPLKPTYAGECYLSAAKRILGVQRELDIQLNEILQSKKGKLVIGCGSRLLPILLPQILPPFIKAHPGIHIQLIENDLKHLIEMLHTGNLDLIFTNRPIDSLNLGCVPLYREEAMLYTPQDYLQLHQITETNPINLCDHRDIPFVFMKTGSVLKMTDAIFNEYGFSPNTILESTSWEICIAMVAAGIACTILPTRQPSVSQLFPNVNCYHISNIHFRDTAIYYRKNYYHPLVMDAFLTHCKNIFSESH